MKTHALTKSKKNNTNENRHMEKPYTLSSYCYKAPYEQEKGSFDQHRVQFTFSLYSSLMMLQFKMELGNSLGMFITLTTVSFLEDETASIFSLRISFVETLLRPWAKKLFFSYRMTLAFTERLELLTISTETLRSLPVKTRNESYFNYKTNQQSENGLIM